MRRFSYWFISLIFIFSLLISGCTGIGAKPSPTPTEEIGEGVSKVVSATGVVNPAKKATLSVSISGIVEEVLVEKGDKVREGQVLLRLKGKEDINASIAAAKFELLSAQQALNEIYDKLDVSRAASLRTVAEASNAVREAKYRLDNFTIPVAQEGLSALEAMDMTREKLDQAWAAFEPYKNESYLNEEREDLKEAVDNTQADYNTAVKRLTYEFELAEAEANLKEALEDYEILKSGPDPEQLQLAESRLENAKAALASAESLLDDLEIKALFDGTVSEIYTRAGEWVSPGQPMVLIADLQHLRVETTDLNEIDVALVMLGDKAKVTFDALPGVELVGIVQSISPKASEGSGVNYTVLVEIPMIPENLRWGMTAFVDVLVSQ